MTDADITFDRSNVLLVRSDIQWFRRRSGGRTPYGHPSGILTQGVGFWHGTFEFARQSKHGSKGIKGIADLEAFLAEIQDGTATFRVPMSRQSAPLISLVENADPSKAVTYKHGELGTLRTAAGGRIAIPTVNSKTVRVSILPGTRLVVDHQLYLAKQSAGTQVITTAAPQTIPDWPTDSGNEVEIESPYAVGRVLTDFDITMSRVGSFGGPWSVRWEQA